MERHDLYTVKYCRTATPAPIKSGQIQRRRRGGGGRPESCAVSMRGVKKTSYLKFILCWSPIPTTAKKAYSSVLWIYIVVPCSYPLVPLLKKVAESYGKNFGALKLVNFWHPLSSLGMLPQVLLCSAPLLYEKSKTFGNVHGYTKILNLFILQ